MRTTDEPVRVLYVSGWVYSGSTLLSNVLGVVEGFFAAGEVRQITNLAGNPMRHGYLDRV